jgi:hypothetical protein
MVKKKSQQLSGKEVEKLLSKQTTVILNAVSEKTINLESTLKREMERMEFRINQKIDKLTTTLDKFLKRLTDAEDEFSIMKADINRMKKIIREKLGVELS